MGGHPGVTVKAHMCACCHSFLIRTPHTCSLNMHPGFSVALLAKLVCTLGIGLLDQSLNQMLMSRLS